MKFLGSRDVGIIGSLRSETIVEGKGGEPMAGETETRATLDDLYKVEGKAELIDGRIVQFMASGDLLTEVALNICISLRTYAKKVGKGVAKCDGIGYAISELPS